MGGCGDEEENGEDKRREGDRGRVKIKGRGRRK